jgi:micrococcal nuclease
MNSDTVKTEVTVKSFIDGDTVHFYVPESVNPTGVLKARFLGINTPESTGKIEEWGKKAAAFTREKLSSATSIIIESETSTWNPDSTGDRYLVWVWYKTEEMTEYRNLNIEILQNGLARPNNSANNRYGAACTGAINQARSQGLHVHSGQKDPDFYYGEAVELTLKELRTNTEAYSGMKVAFTGVVTVNDGSSVYVESYDSETGLYYGMAVYYGFNLNGTGLDILSVGNEVRIVGSVQYYEAGGTWQVSDLTYRMMKPDDPGNIQKISEGNSPAFAEVSPETFVNGMVDVLVNDEAVQLPYARLILATTVEMKGLQVVEVYTTTDESSDSRGAMTLICQADGHRISIRTTVFRDENGEIITEDAYLGRTIDVRGIVDYFDGSYQIKVFTPDNITIIN